MGSITLPLLELELKTYKKMDLQKKMDIATNVSEKIEEYSSKESSEDAKLMDKISSLTGVNADILQRIHKLEDVSRKFAEWTKERELSISNNSLYALVRVHLHEFYTKDREIPTKSAILNMFKHKQKPEVQLIFNKFFTTIKVPGTESSLIVEKPEKVFKRYQYLHKKIVYLKAEKSFVYIEDMGILSQRGTFIRMSRPQNDLTTRFVLAVSPTLGYVSSIYCCRTNEMHLRHWMVEKVIPKLAPGSVVVIQDKIFDEVCDPPGDYATKQEMLDWLQKRDIPHDICAHRAELLVLIETYKRSFAEMTKVEHLLQLNGHTALFRHEGVDFEYFEPLWKKLKQLLDLRTGLRLFENVTAKKQIPYRAKKIVTLIQKEYWQALEGRLLDMEVNAYKKDLEMEEVVDKLMTFAKYEKLEPAESEFDDYCKATAEEYMFFWEKLTQSKWV